MKSGPRNLLENRESLGLEEAFQDGERGRDCSARVLFSIPAQQSEKGEEKREGLFPTCKRSSFGAKMGTAGETAPRQWPGAQSSSEVTPRAANPHWPSGKASTQTTSQPSSLTAVVLFSAQDSSGARVPHEVVARIVPSVHSDRVPPDVTGLGRALLVPICSRNVEHFKRNIFPSLSLTLSWQHSVWANGDLELL